jgi:hypothetical protein
VQAPHGHGSLRHLLPLLTGLEVSGWAWASFNWFQGSLGPYGWSWVGTQEDLGLSSVLGCKGNLLPSRE